MKKIPKVILMIETSRSSDFDLLRGIAKYSHIKGPWIFHREIPSYILQEGKGKKLISQLNSLNADGIITRDTINMDHVIALGIPCIVVRTMKNEFPPFPNITTDCVAEAKMGAEHLLERGFKNLAYCGFDDMFWSQHRKEVFGQRIREAGFEPYFYTQPKSRNAKLWKNEITYMAKWLDSLPKPVGVMACNDDRGIDILDACKVAKIRVPEDIAVLGVDNDLMICELSDPPLSSISRNPERVGYEAAELLDKLMSGQEQMASQKIIGPPTYIATRQSTDVFAIEDKDVASALRFIRQVSKKMISVDHVADAVKLSRRTLEKKFKKNLRRSIQQEIRRIRVDEMIKMLIDTNMSISEISQTMGFHDVNNIARYFRLEKKMTLLEYRKLHGQK